MKEEEAEENMEKRKEKEKETERAVDEKKKKTGGINIQNDIIKASVRSKGGAKSSSTRGDAITTI